MMYLLAIGSFAIVEVQAQSKWTQKHLISSSNQVLLECREFDQRGLLKEHWKYDASPQLSVSEMQRYYYDSAQAMVSKIDLKVDEGGYDSIAYLINEKGTQRMASRFTFFLHTDKLAQRGLTVENHFPDSHLVWIKTYVLHGNDSIMTGYEKTIQDTFGEKIESTYFIALGGPEFRSERFIIARDKKNQVFARTVLFYQHRNGNISRPHYANHISAQRYRYGKSGRLKSKYLEEVSPKGKWRKSKVQHFKYDSSGKLKREKLIVYSYKEVYDYREPIRKTKETFKYRFTYLPIECKGF
jgi:hypothetical protein